MKTRNNNSKNSAANCEKNLTYLNNLRKVNCTQVAYNDITSSSKTYPPAFFFYPYNNKVCIEASRQYVELLNQCNVEEHKKFMTNKS